MTLIGQQKLNQIQKAIISKSKDTDDICASYINFENPNYIDIDGIYFGALIVTNYQREMEELFLDKVMSLDIDMQISMYYNKLNSNEVIKELTYNIGNAGAQIKTSSDNQQDIDILGSTYGDAKHIRKQLQLGDEELFNLTLYLGVFAEKRDKLERDLQKLESVALSIGLNTIRGNYRQEDTFYSMLPLLSSNNDIERFASRNVLTSGLVATYPFVSNELFDKEGIMIGVNSFDNSLIMLDRFDTEKYKNANMFVIGTSGSGKSYFIKLMLNRNRFLNINQFVIDPDREYLKICEALSGTVINFSGQHLINVLDIRNIELEEGETYLGNKLSKLKVFFSLVFENMNEEENAHLEELLIKAYEEKGITEDNNSLFKKQTTSALLNKKEFKSAKDMPILEDLYDLLKKDRKLKRCANILKPYITGSLKCLNGYTNVDADNKLVVADVHNIQEKDLPIVMFVITDYFWDMIRNDRTKKKILYLDEVWKLINKNENTAEFVFKLFKTIRKYGGAATAITQDISDFFSLEDGKYGKGILNNSSIKTLFQLEETDIELLCKVLNISEEEKCKLINLKRGTAIVHAGRNTLMVDVVASKKEHEYITTDYISN